MKKMLPNLRLRTLASGPIEPMRLNDGRVLDMQF